MPSAPSACYPSPRSGPFRPLKNTWRKLLRRVLFAVTPQSTYFYICLVEFVRSLHYVKTAHCERFANTSGDASSPLLIADPKSPQYGCRVLLKSKVFCSSSTVFVSINILLKGCERTKVKECPSFHCYCTRLD